MRAAFLAFIAALAMLAPPVFAEQAPDTPDAPYVRDWTKDDEKPATGNLPPEFFSANSQTVIDKVIKAYGGHAAIAASENVLAKGRMFDIADEKYYTYMYYLAPGGRLRTDMVIGGRSDVQVLNRWQSYHETGGLTRYRIKGLELEELTLKRTCMTVPLLFSSGSYSASYLGSASYEGRLVYSLLIERKGAPVLGVDVDVKTGLIVKVTARLEDDGESLPVEWHFGDYVQLNSTMLPKKVLHIRDGVLVESFEIFRFSHDQIMSDSLFQ